MQPAAQRQADAGTSSLARDASASDTSGDAAHMASSPTHEGDASRTSMPDVGTAALRDGGEQSDPAPTEGGLEPDPEGGATALLPGQECNDGNADERDSCIAQSGTWARCGDGFVYTTQTAPENLQPLEECDLGPDNGGIGSDCTLECKFDRCGDGHLGPGEVCDDGNNDDPADGCDCCVHDCGWMDGVVDHNEECDDGASEDTDSCIASQGRWARCGDWLVYEEQTDPLNPNPLEECDDGAQNGQPTSLCTADCKWNVCGDGVVGPDESCDEGTSNGEVGSACGFCCGFDCGRQDGIVQQGEECDDGNDDASDSCLADVATWASCGDGQVYRSRTDDLNEAPLEECDHGSAGGSDGGAGSCSAECTLTDAAEESCAAGHTALVGALSLRNAGAEGATLCVRGATDGLGLVGFDVTSAAVPTQTGPALFPALVMGWDTGGQVHGVGHSLLEGSLAVSSLNAVLIDYWLSVPRSGVQVAALSSWLAETSAPLVTEGAVELELWLANRDGTPVGEPVTTVSMPDGGWDVWSGDNGEWTTITFVAALAKESGALDLKPFYDSALELELMPEGLQLLGIHVGFRIWESQEKLAWNSLRVVID